MKNRNLYLDILKGVLILLVVWGHCVQYIGYNGSRDFFTDPVYQWIYGFHMPMFIFISGYLLNPNIGEKKIITNTLQKGKNLIIPMLLWILAINTVFYCIGKMPLDNYKNLSPLAHIGTSIIGKYWFIWVLFYCTIIIHIIKRKTTHQYRAIICAFIVILLISDKWPNFLYLKFLFPFYVAGMIARNYKEEIKKRLPIITVCCAVIYGLCMINWKTDYYIYMDNMNFHKGKNLLTLFQHSGMRYLAGISGIGLFCGIVYYLSRLIKPRFISDIGTKTLIIYFINEYIITIFCEQANKSESGFLFTYPTWIYAAVCTLIVYGLSKILERNNLFNVYLLGGKPLVRTTDN